MREFVIFVYSTKVWLMKKSFLFIAVLIFGVASAQQNEVDEFRKYFQKPLGEKDPVSSLQALKMLSTKTEPVEMMVYFGELPCGEASLYTLSQDGMPCVVPKMDQFNMPCVVPKMEGYRMPNGANKDVSIRKIPGAIPGLKVPGVQ